MRRRPHLLSLAVVLAAALSGASATAEAQATPQPPVRPPTPTPTTLPGARPAATPGPSRGFVTFGAGAQIGSTDFSETHSEPLNAEQKTWTADYAVKTGFELEVGGAWRAWQNLFVGATYSYFHDSRAADVNAQIPHPFFFNQPRSISGESSSLSHDENALHPSLWWMVPVGRRLEVGVFGGPSIIWVSRQMVKDVEYTESYPYDAATFSKAVIADASKTAFGVHGGVDVTWMLSKEVGVGGSIRYSHASTDSGTPAGGTTSFDAGGLQAAATVRFRILGKTPPPPPVRPAPPRPPAGAANPDTRAGAVTTATAPVFLRPDATMTPLRQLPVGTHLRVLDQTGDWLHVEFDDRQYGRRVGYVQKAFVRIEGGR